MDDSEVCHWRKKRDSSALIANIRVKQGHEDWFPCMPWMHIHEYYFHRMLEMGYGLEDETVRRAIDNLLDLQLPDGGYMHPTGRNVNIPDPYKGWAPCMTGYVINALMDLGLTDHPKISRSLQVMQNRQNQDGGWICREGPCVDESNCIQSGTPWVFVCLVKAQLINIKSPIAKKAIEALSRYKVDIIQHGYMKDRCYRCDESLILPPLYALGLSTHHQLFRDLLESLMRKQQSDGSWLFRGKRSAWYTIEVIAALQKINAI